MSRALTDDRAARQLSSPRRPALPWSLRRRPGVPRGGGRKQMYPLLFGAFGLMSLACLGFYGFMV